MFVKIMYRICSKLSVIYIFFYSFSLQSQLDTVLIFDHFNKSNTCPFNEAYNAISDQNDHIWIGTNSGLYRYDGMDFKQVNFEPKLAFHKIIPFTIDDKQNIYFSIEDVGLGIYNLLDHEFSVLSSNKNDSTSLNSNVIDDLIIDNSNNAWIIFENNGFCKLDLNNKKVKRIYPKDEILDSNCRRLNSLTTLYLDPCDSDILWIGANYGILKFQISSEKLSAFNNCDIDSGKLGVRCLTRKNCNELMIGSWHKSLVFLNTISKEFEVFDSESKFKNISDIIPLENGEYLMSDSEKGLAIYNSSKNRLQSISPVMNSKNLQTDVTRAIPDIYQMHKSGECFWATSPTHGLSRFNLVDGRKSFYTGYSSTLITQLKKNNILTVDKNGIRVIDLNQYTLDSVLFSKKYRNIPNFELVDIKCKNDTAFILTTKSLFQFYDGKLTSLLDSKNFDHDFLSFHISNNQIYLGTRRKGVIVFKTPRIDAYNYHKDTTSYDHSIPYIRSIAADTSNNLWFGTKNGLFYSSNIKEGFFNYEIRFSDDDNRTITRVEKLHFDIKNNRLWFVATGLGLSYISLSSNSKINLDKFLFRDQQIIDIKSDKNKNIWVLTENSIAILEKENIDTPYYLPWRGTLSNKDLKAIDFANTKEMLVGWSEGFELRSLNFKSKKDLNVFFDELEVNGKPIQITSSVYNLEENQNNLKVVINSSGTFGKRNIAYKSKLEGLQSNWSTVEQANSVLYKNLKPGNYTLVVSSSGLVDNQEGHERKWRFRINEYWVNTISFKIFLGFLCFSIISYFVYLKFKEKKINLSKEKALNDQRNRIATEMHDDLGGGLTIIKYLSLGMLKKINNLEQQEKLSKIITHSNALVSNMNDIIWALHGDDDELLNLIAYCRKYSSEYLADHNLNLKFNMEKGIDNNIVFSGIKKRQIFLAFKEILHNIIKHSNASNVSIQWTLLGESLILLVHDDGIGFQIKNNKKYTGLGYGVRNIQVRVKQIGGTVNWKYDHGTQVEITIPVTF